MANSHRSADANYHIWDDIPQLMAVIDQLGVSGAHIVGHSRGAAVAGMLAVALNERCLSLTMLDGMISRSFENDDGAELFRTSLAERTKYMARPPRIFESVEQFIDSARDTVSRVRTPRCWFRGHCAVLTRGGFC